MLIPRANKEQFLKKLTQKNGLQKHSQDFSKIKQQPFP